MQMLPGGLFFCLKTDGLLKLGHFLEKAFIKLSLPNSSRLTNC